ncbi:MAG: signal peptidase I [bacterium]|nr:signal peptidase I [bacterium]
MQETDQFPPINNTSDSNFSYIMMFVWDFLKVILIALAIIIPIRYFLFQPFVVSGSSMEPNFSNGQYLIIDEITYRFRQPQRGEVLVIRFPEDRKQFFIKRIIGLPGEQIKIDNGRVTVSNTDNPNGIVVDETYLPNQGLTFPHSTSLVGGKNILSLQDDEYFMLGDNRLASSDSRDWGILNEEDIVGKVFLRALPLPTFGLFEAPQYSF